MSGARCPCCDYDIDDCECTDRWPEGRPRDIEAECADAQALAYAERRANKYRDVLQRSVDWWLSDGRNDQVGAPEWVFAARQLLDG